MRKNKLKDTISDMETNLLHDAILVCDAHIKKYERIKNMLQQNGQLPILLVDYGQSEITALWALAYTISTLQHIKKS